MRPLTAGAGRAVRPPAAQRSVSRPFWSAGGRSIALPAPARSSSPSSGSGGDTAAAGGAALAGPPEANGGVTPQQQQLAPLAPPDLAPALASFDPPEHEWAWKGAKLGNAAAAVALGAALRFGVPVPEGLDPQGWTLLAFFLTTVAGLVLEPVAAGAWALMCVGCALAAHALTFEEAFAAADSQVLWLIVNAFFLARGIEKTGLGERIAEALVQWFGGSTRSLAMSLALGEALLASGMPSTTARAAGIFVPVIKSVSAAGGSLPTDDESRLRIGAYLTLSQLQSVAHSSALFVTASAQNLLCIQLAEACGVELGPNHFLLWAQGAIVPAIVGTLVTPNVAYLVQPPTVKETPEAPKQAARRLRQLGKLTQDEIVMMGAVAIALTLWTGGESIGVPPVVASMLAVGMLLATGVLDWRADCLRGCPQAFDTLFWFGVLVSMSLALQQHGVIDVFTGWASSNLSGLDLAWPALFGALHLLFFAFHYLFASQTAHVGALYTAFLSLMLAGGVPPKLAAMSLAYNCCLQGGLTHYASSQSAAYYGTGYLKLREVFVGGAVCGSVSLAVWATFGMGWWHVIGWW
ncbi:dicarboxylate transporter chloroplastic-like [Raphidocelis subcapitata]|uniref:Dicarboxylate transporter chloroplastic-like n=1 Tax=Raphidocelis subcapitata TaxID=307507 RepID=A0A2V0PBQ3_9CHLO|nr:dicarboxylate transporter chloroplastic-like [Raphidocelis subcapitata]|eukprot:GBF97276.1 dicarboxylate transporter chloroplastic-like [Raphidocelis subcapitata]